MRAFVFRPPVYAEHLLHTQNVPLSPPFLPCVMSFLCADRLARLLTHACAAAPR